MSRRVGFIFCLVLAVVAGNLNSTSSENEPLNNDYVEDEGTLSPDGNDEPYATILLQGLCMAQCLDQGDIGLPAVEEENEMFTTEADCLTEHCQGCLQCIENRNGNSCGNKLNRFCYNVSALENGVLGQLESQRSLVDPVSSPSLLRPIFHCSTFIKYNSTFDVYFRMEYEEQNSTLTNLTERLPRDVPRLFVLQKFVNGILSSESPILTKSWLLSVNVPANLSSQIRVTPISVNRIHSPLYSRPLFLTLNSERGQSQTPKNVTIKRIRQNPSVTSHPDLQVLLHWKSGMGTQATCSFRIWILENDDKTYEFKEANTTFWFYLTNQTKGSSLDFEREYSIQIMEMSDVESESTSVATEFSIRLPPCLEFFYKNYTMCPPSPPTNLTFVIQSDNSVLVSWTPPLDMSDTNIIENYEIRLIQYIPHYSSNGISMPPTAIQYQSPLANVTVAGTSTSYLFTKLAHSGVIKVQIRAVSEGGPSKIVSEGPGNMPLNLSDSVPYKITIAGAVFVFFITVMVSIVFYKFRQDKRNRHIARARYCGDDKVVSCKIETPYFPPYCSKWLIDTNCLKMGELIGEGNFGHVHAATLYKLESSRIVAVKTLKEGLNLRERSKFWEEFQILKNLEPHQHVVRLIGIVKANYPTIVVEYCDGGDLHTYLRKLRDEKSKRIARDKRRLKWMSSGTISGEFLRNSACNIGSDRYINSGGDEDETIDLSVVTNEAYFSNPKVFDVKECVAPFEFNRFVSFGRQIAAGMEFLSNNKIVHRDLAARNVLVINEPKTILKIADFGLSRDVYEKNWYKKNSDDKIPFKWLAIECLLDEVYTTKSDVWSYGVLLWEIVTYGGSPYPGIKNMDIFEFLMKGYRMAQPENCPRDLYVLMRKCWEKECDNRPDFASIRRLLDDMLENAQNRSYFQLQDDAINQIPSLSSETVQYAEGIQIARKGQKLSNSKSTYESPITDFRREENVQYSTLATLSTSTPTKSETVLINPSDDHSIAKSNGPIAFNYSDNLLYASLDSKGSRVKDLGQSLKSSSSTMSLCNIRIKNDDSGNDDDVEKEPKYENDTLHVTPNEKARDAATNGDGSFEFDLAGRDEKTLGSSVRNKKVMGIPNIFVRTSSSSLQFVRGNKWKKNETKKSNKHSPIIIA